MNGFKQKKNKKNKFNKKSITTLDKKHTEILNDFEKNERSVIPNLKFELLQLTEKLSNDDLSVEMTLDIEDKISEINDEIRQLKISKKNYFLDNSKFIFEYFENKKNISDGTEINAPLCTNKTNAINSFFKIKQKEEPDPQNVYKDSNNNIVQKYLGNINENYLNINSFVFQTDICQSCNKGELIPIDDEGIMVCNICSRSIRYLIENDKPSYKEPPKEVCFYAYKRINHFKEIISQFQGKETTQIPHEIVDNIKLQIKKERLNLDQITNIKTKELLKKLGYNKYYEHIPFIKDKLGIKPPVMTAELEETLCNLFVELQMPYSKFCPDNRVNFLNYYYTAYKLCELLRETQYLQYFPMLKDREKKIEQDNIWKQICKELNWEFISTI